jgi:hypothetical protein
MLRVNRSFEGYSEFLKTRNYDWFFTGTMNYESSQKVARRNVERQLAMLSKHYQCESFWVMELHKSGSPHIHSLIRLRDNFGCHYSSQFTAILRSWNIACGEGVHRTKLISVRKNENSFSYVAKYLTKSYLAPDYDIYFS